MSTAHRVGDQANSPVTLYIGLVNFNAVHVSALVMSFMARWIHSMHTTHMELNVILFV